jgi:hypothetical protein
MAALFVAGVAEPADQVRHGVLAVVRGQLAQRGVARDRVFDLQVAEQLLDRGVVVAARAARGFDQAHHALADQLEVALRLEDFEPHLVVGRGPQLPGLLVGRLHREHLLEGAQGLFVAATREQLNALVEGALHVLRQRDGRGEEGGGEQQAELPVHSGHVDGFLLKDSCGGCAEGAVRAEIVRLRGERSSRSQPSSRRGATGDGVDRRAIGGCGARG